VSSTDTGLRDQILATAKNLFIQHGYYGLSMREISDALGVSKAALYYYFKDKEQLFLAILTTYLDENETVLDHILAQPVTSQAQIRLFVEHVLTQPAEQRAIIRLASQEISHLEAASRQAFDELYRQKFIGKLQAILRAGMEHNELKPMQLDVAVWALMGIMYPYFYPAHAGNSPISAETIQMIVEIYLNGLGQ
jgi:AcrR family transcriptional regulator